MSSTSQTRRLFGVTTAAMLAGGIAACATSPGDSAIAAHAAGDAPWYDILVKEHREVDAMLSRLVAADVSEAEKARLAKSVKIALTQHALREENVVYPQLRLFDLNDPAEELFGEHAEIKTLLAYLTITSPSSFDWSMAAQRLAAVVREHVQDEELRVFPMLKAKLTPEQGARLTRLVREEAARYRTS